MDSKKIGFWSGIVLFAAILIFFNPDDLSQRGQITAAVFILMGIWWATEALPLPATCLLYTSPSPRDTEVSRMPSSA